MNADAILGMLTLGSYVTMLAVEGLWPARTFPKIRLWRLVGVAFLVLIMALGIGMPLLLPVEWLAHAPGFDAPPRRVRRGGVGGPLARPPRGYPLPPAPPPGSV